MYPVPSDLDQEKNSSPFFSAQKKSTYWLDMSDTNMVLSPKGAMPRAAYTHSITAAGMAKARAGTRYCSRFPFMPVSSPALPQNVNGPLLYL